MRVYIKNIGHIKDYQNFKILFWSRESEKPIFTIFLEILTRKIRVTGISSETTIPGISSEPTEDWESVGALGRWYRETEGIAR